ncbi:MAG: tetratricopeptide repeat protein [bacterium]|nr:tetratricopeptide repeat protein [bacterium]
MRQGRYRTITPVSILLLILLPLSCATIFAAETPEDMEKKLLTLDVPGQIKLLNRFCKKNWDQYPKKSIEFARRSLKLARQSGDENSIAIAFNNMGNGHLYGGSYSKAVKYYRQALKIQEKRGSKKQIAPLLNNIGIVYWNLKDLDMALEYLLRSLQLKESLPKKPGVGSTLNNIGLVYTDKKEYGSALEYFQKALKLFRQKDIKKGIGHVLNNMGDAYAGLENYPLALNHYKEAVAVYKESDFRWGIANTRKNVGKLHTKTGEFDLALECLNEGLELSEKLNSKDLILKSYIGLFQFYEAKGEFEPALEFHKKYLQLNTTVFDEKKCRRIERMETLYMVDKKEKEIQLLRKDNYIRGMQRIFLLIILVFTFLLGIVVYSRYSSKKKNTQLLRLSEARYRLLFSEAGDAILLMDRGGIVDCNEKTLQMYGGPRETLVGHTFDEFSPRVQPDGVSSRSKGVAMFRRAVEGETQRFYWRFRKKDGTHIDTTISLNAVEIQKKVLLHVIIHDITRHKQLEEERIKTAKLESVGILAAGIAHDFNNLLSVILGNLTLGKMAAEKDARLTKILGKIESSACSATTLANQFLSFSEGGLPVKKPVNLGEVIREVIAEVPIDDNTECNLDIKENLPLVECDREQVKRVFIGLIENAVEAVERRGEIRVSVVAIRLNAEEVPFLRAEEYLKIIIRDGGRGISEENLSRIFDPYFTTKRNVSAGGTGLGLSIVHSIIKNHKGTVSVSSHVGVGTVFRVYLPVG